MNPSSFTFDNADRLTNLTADLAGTARDLSISFDYNRAGQIASTTRSPDAYAWNAHYNIDRVLAWRCPPDTAVSSGIKVTVY